MSVQSFYVPDPIRDTIQPIVDLAREQKAALVIGHETTRWLLFFKRDDGSANIKAEVLGYPTFVLKKGLLAENNWLIITP